VAAKASQELMDDFMYPELDDKIHTRVKELCKDGDRLIAAKEFSSALKEYQKALGLLPSPISDWEAGTWIWVAIGDAHFRCGNFPEAYNAFSEATHCPGGLGNPYVHLRLGEVQFELGNEILAADELARAYMGGGKEIFAEELPKYFEFVKSKLHMPPEGW
jgi:tetratricopeptide (TPR) repeat protein